MNNLFNEFIATYGVTIMYTVLTAVFGYAGIVAKNVYTKYVNDKTKRAVVQTCVTAIEQIYKDLDGEEKLDKCIEAASEMFEEKGIQIGATELHLLIESSVIEFKKGFDSDSEAVGV